MLKRACRDILWRLGVDVHGADPDRSPDLFRALLLADRRVDCVVDVGANVGQFAEGLRRSGYRGPIHSFEPVAASVPALRARAQRDRSWFVHAVALGRTAGLATMGVPASTNLASFRRLSDAPAGLTTLDPTSRPEAVRVETLARVGVELPGARVFLKLDTQGYDLEVVEGAGGFLDRVVAIQTEVSVLPMYEGAPTICDVLPRLAALGFTPSTFIPGFRDEQARLREADVILVRT